jgi:hypothetical protein
MFDYAEAEYKKIAKWIEENSKDYDIMIYPQGSFALGTAVKPYDREDEYDVDLVCEYQKDYGFTAKRLKKTEVYSILTRYARAFRIKEKRRCWQVTYEHNKKFHLDVIPAVLRGSYIDITEQLSSERYEYIGSNPKGYISWFQSKQRIRYNAIRTSIVANQKGIYTYGEIKPIKEYKIRTPLQKAIQILKRHRDILFMDDPNNLAPISILITTIAADLYRNEDTISETLNSILSRAKEYVEEHKENGEYCIYNPSLPSENFADKWAEHPERAEAFLNWLDDAKKDLMDNFTTAQSDVEIATLVECALGRSVTQFVFRGNNAVITESSNDCEGVEKALVPYKVQAILSAPQRQKLPSYPRGYRVIIGATIEKPDGTKYRYKSDDAPIDKDCSIVFTAGFSGVQKPFKLKWQVVNTGYQARSVNGLRGEFSEEGVNEITHRESTLYTGSHAIQCFVFKKGRCVAQSKIFIVNIK